MNANIIHLESANASLACENQLTNQTLKWTLDRIKSSQQLIALPLNCDQLKSLDRSDENNFLLTTGRKARKSVICLSANKDNPCEYALAVLNQGADPSKALMKAFSYQSEPSIYLNETVERLFINPSKLIQAD